eukprot:1591417-Rhodomonas_salina.2
MAWLDDEDPSDFQEQEEESKKAVADFGSVKCELDDGVLVKHHSPSGKPSTTSKSKDGKVPPAKVVSSVHRPMQPSKARTTPMSSSSQAKTSPPSRPGTRNILPLAAASTKQQRRGIPFSSSQVLSRDAIIRQTSPPKAVASVQDWASKMDFLAKRE